MLQHFRLLRFPDQPLRVFINGKFVVAPQTGVQRVAQQLLRSLDRLATEGESPHEWTLCCPRRPITNHVFTRIKVETQGNWPSLLWEQLAFATKANQGLLLNMCNSGPLLARNAVTIIHDAQVYTSPKSYSRAFRAWYRLMQPTLGRRHKKIVTVSHFSKSQLVEYGVAPAAKIEVVYNGVDHILSETADRSILLGLNLMPKRFVVALASTQFHKNIRVLIEAFSSPELADLKLVLFGKDDRDRFETYYGAKLPENLIFAGKVSDAQLRALYENALAFAFPSLTEGFGLPILEAMTVGCPAVAAPCGALPEVCGEAAMYADPHKPQEWIAHLRLLRGSDEAWQAQRQKSLVQGARFTWKNAAAKLLDILNACE